MPPPPLPACLPCLQIKLPPNGGRLIIATDGLWDSMPAGRVARVLRNHACPKSAAMQAVASVAAARGGVPSDDVTGERLRGLGVGWSWGVFVVLCTCTWQALRTHEGCRPLSPLLTRSRVCLPAFVPAPSPTGWPAVLVVDILPPGCPDFKRVCSQFKGRLRSALSTPSLASLAETPAAAAVAAAAPRPVRRSSSSGMRSPA